MTLKLRSYESTDWPLACSFCGLSFVTHHEVKKRVFLRWFAVASFYECSNCGKKWTELGG